MIQSEYNWSAAKVLLSAWLFLFSALLVASPEEAEQAEEKARANFVEHFTNFIQDKNVMGRATTPDGKPSTPGPNKTQFNKDDGASYKSDLTYHDFSYTSDDGAFRKQQEGKKEKDKDGKEKGPSSRSLLPFVSSHGGLSEAGGSSALERKMYELHDKFSKKDEDEKEKERQKKEEEEKGIKYRSAFKIDTKEVSKSVQKEQPPAQGGGQPGAGGNAPKADKKKDEEPDKVERVTLREEAVPEVAKVGEDSFQTIERSNRDKGFEDDSQTLGNSTLLREAAARATESWWNSTLANLNQRRVNRAGIDGKPELNEDTPTCEAWAQKELQQRQQQIQKAGGKVDPKQIEEQKKELDQAKQKCEEVTKLSYNAVSPKFEPKEDGKGEELKTGDLEKEDPYSRDLRNQLEVLKSAGKDVKSLKSNWDYEEKDEKQQITIGFDENGEPTEKVDWTVRDQLDSYNQQLEDAAKGFKEVKERFPQLEINEDEINKFKIDPDTQSAMEINQLTSKQKEDLGVTEDPEKQQGYSVPEDYNGLLEKSKGPSSR